jgi:lysozyme
VRLWPALVITVATVGGIIGAVAIHYSRTDRGPVQPPPCDTGPVTRGIDVSYYQGEIDWDLVRGSGIEFAFIRVSDGVDNPDSMFELNWGGAKAAGIRRGLYQYFRPADSVTEQADLAIAMLKKRGAGELPPVLDIEDDGGLSPGVVAKRARMWIDRVQKQLHVEPIVYTYPDFWRRGGAEALGTQQLWIAHYTTACPTIPPPWKTWQFWQHSDRGRVPGITGAVDLDLAR